MMKGYAKKYFKIKQKSIQVCQGGFYFKKGTVENITEKNVHKIPNKNEVSMCYLNI